MTCIIVRQGAYEEYDHLYAASGHQMPIIWDRRRARSRPLANDTAPSASNPNRRQKPPVSWTVFGFVVVERSAAWTRAAVSACEEDHYIVAQAELASQ